MGLTADPKITFRNLLRNNWDNTNTSIAYDPKVHTGWVNIDWSQPQITVTNRRESPLGGGVTGFTSIDPTGSGANKRMLGRISIIAWSSRDMEDSVNPKKVVFEFAQEVERIVTVNVFDAGGGLDWISFMSAEDRVDTNVDPTLYRQDMRISYEYVITP